MKYISIITLIRKKNGSASESPYNPVVEEFRPWGLFSVRLVFLPVRASCSLRGRGPLLEVVPGLSLQWLRGLRAQALELRSP